VNVTIKGLSVSDPSTLTLILENTYHNAAVVAGNGYGSTAPLNKVTFTLDDQAQAPIPDPLTSGTWQPANTLWPFIGDSPYGPWTLYANCNTGCSGKISGWSIQVATEEPTG